VKSARLRLLILLAIALPAACAAGCGHVPRIIVLKDPLSAPEHVDLGVAYERKGELDLALKEYEKALRKDPKMFQARVDRGNVFLAKGEYGKAREEYLRALEIRPGDPEATNNLAWAALRSGKELPDALARMEAVSSGPGGRSAPMLDTLGSLRMRLGKPEAAEEAFAAAEEACRAAGEAPGGCPETVRREIGEHREALRRAFPRAVPPLVK
jgi:Tfp pilus assembly protein PilF